MKWLITILFFLQLPSKTGDGTASQNIKDGNRLYKGGQMADAEKVYNEAVNSEYKYTAIFNKGNAQYRQKKLDKAIATYAQAANDSNTDKTLRSAAFYNTGVVYSNQKNLEASIEEYKNALRLNWKDTKARENLQKALMELKKQSGGGGGGEKEEQSQQQSKSNISQNQARQQLERLEEKERASQQKITEKKGQYGGSAGKDW